MKTFPSCNGISLIVASYNGAETLPKVFAAFSRLTLPQCPVEFVLIDNRSSDQTGTLMQQFLTRHPGQYIREDTPGKSAALNTGLRHASGDLIIFTDDDVIPDCGWLCAYWSAASANPKHPAFAGQIRLNWPSQPAKWLLELEQHGRTLGATPINLPDGPIEFSQVKGANCALRRCVVEAGEQFDLHLGVSSQGPVLAGEETALMQRIQLRGERVWFVSAASLQHIVRPNQMGIWPLIRRGFRNGRGGAAMNATVLPPSRWMLLGIPGYTFKTIARIVCQSAWRIARGQLAQGISEILRAAEVAGEAYQSKQNAEAMIAAAREPTS